MTHQPKAMLMWLRPSEEHYKFSCLRLCHHLVSIFILLLFPCFSAPHRACNQIDLESLLSFSRDISTPLNWSSSVSDCCQWEGISCDEEGWVTHLWLPLRGLKGHISPSLVNLTRLSHLNLSHNSLSGQLPPPSASSNSRLISLHTIDLSSNLLSGNIQTSLLELSWNLTILNLSNNTFSGLIPSSICMKSKFVTILDLSLNQFEGQIPYGLGSCSTLEVFRAGFNNLSGSLPDDIYDAVTLREISLPCNRISGIMDGDRIVHLTNLAILELYFNELSSALPWGIGKLANLEHLRIHTNNLTGSLPPSLTNCTKLRSLNLRHNFLEGDISTFDFSSLLKLKTLDLGNNNFSGSLPLSLFSCKSLTAVRLAKNQIHGQIPLDILALQTLSFLSLSYNRLTNITGAFQILMGCNNLTALILTKNFVGEAIPDVGNSDSGLDGFFQNLRVLGLGGSQLTGQVPPWLAKLRKLEALDLSRNRLTGLIPVWLGALPSLFYIDLSDNLIWGEFPVELTFLPILVSEQAAVQVDQSYLELPVFVKPNNVTSQQYNQLSDLPPAIYLRNNSLSGAIPKEIGRLRSLHVLELSNNNFSGKIPNQLSNLTNLERLDLSRNQLSGEIPPSLKRLNFLSWFSVADNNLQGPIPIGGQFDTFSYSSFEGNPGLCGSVLLEHPCRDQTGETSHPTTPKPTKYPDKKLIVGLIVGICFGTGFIFTVLALWMLSKRRIDPRRDGVDNEKINVDIASCNSNPSTSIPPEDSTLVMLFPGKNNEFKDLTISDILKATDNFDQANIIGCGGFGLVYKATLVNGTKLAVKKLSGDLGLMEREFKAEVEALSTAQHKNLVSLQGYYVHGAFRLLIYSYMQNGSLDYWLHEKMDGASQLDWPTRLRIAQGASRGLSYIHQICQPHIVHRDIKSSNILLDDKFEAHVADFGLSRLILPYKTHVTTELVGTLGYIPPEYGQAWVATLRGDMYSFGVVMIELLTGKRPIEVFKPKMSRAVIGWVQQMRHQGKQDQVFDPLLMGKGFEEEMIKVLDVACMCVNHNPFQRPTINEVVGWLENVRANQLAPK